jgi:TDG/mug DNA glycosylase family protein
MTSSRAGTDLLADDLDALIVAINPSSRSEQVGHPFSSPGNPFWRLLHESGLTPIQVPPSQSHRLLEFGLGLTSTVPRATPAAAALTAAELRAGARAVEEKVTQHRPRLVVLLGLTLYPLFFPTGISRGPGPKPERIGGAPVFVVPNPSGRNRAYPGFESKLAWYRALGDRVSSDRSSRAQLLAASAARPSRSTGTQAWRERVQVWPDSAS